MGWIKNFFGNTDEKVFDKKSEYKIFVFDTETTWTDPKKDRIIQISWILWTLYTEVLATWEIGYSFEEERTINEYINIDWEIPEEASKIHGIYKKDIENCKDISYYMDDLVNVVMNVDFVIWHNIDFDLTILHEEEYRCRLKTKIDYGLYLSKIEKIDTMKSSSEIVNWRWWKWPKLIELYKFLFHHGFDWAHDSMSDVKATLECFIELAKRYKVFDVIFNPESVYYWRSKNSLKWAIENWYLDHLQYVTDYQFEQILDSINREEIPPHCKDCRGLSLKWLKTLTDKQAELLIKEFDQYKLFDLDLSWLQKITNKQAECFYHLCNNNEESRYGYDSRNLKLDWLTELTDKQARYLIRMSNQYCNISLEWLTSITDKQVEYLAWRSNNKYNIYPEIYLPNLKTITEKQAKILIKNWWYICVSSDFIPPIKWTNNWYYYKTCSYPHTYHPEMDIHGRMPWHSDYDPRDNGWYIPWINDFYY